MFIRFEHDPKDRVAERSRQRGANTGCHTRIGLHQSGNNNAASHARDCSADGYAIWNNEMLKIDECSDDQERNENPVPQPQSATETVAKSRGKELP